jgi:hypothetical protein
LTVEPATGLTAAGASIKVTGAGFDPAGGLYVAICRHNANTLPNLRTDCVGGPIPAGNTSKSWAHISTSGVAGPGQVAAKWGDGGTFSVDLELPASGPSSPGVDCSKVDCAVITAPDAQTNDTSQDLAIPLTYQAVVTPTTTAAATTTSSSTATSSSPTTTSQQAVTSTVAAAGTTVQPKVIGSPSVAAGGKQQILFAGFAKNEPVTVTLYSEPIKLPNTTADADGIVTIVFTVPVNLPPGTHLLKAVGQTSKVTGVATFEVTAPVVASSSAPSSTAVTSAPASSAIVAPLPLTSASAASSTAPSSRSTAIVVVKKTTTRPVWPWYVLAVVVLLWIALAVYLVQRRRKRLAAENREKERILAEAAAAEQQRAADALAVANSDAPTSYIGPPPSGAPDGYLGYHPGEHGLLSGRDHPDNPEMMSGRRDQPSPGAEGLTASGSPAGSTAPQPAVDPADPAPGSTPAGPDVDGPGTSRWQPNFDDDNGTDTGGPPAGGRPAS